MFDPTSRYYNVEVATMTVTDSDGLPREIRFVKRRFIPSGEGGVAASLSGQASHTRRDFSSGLSSARQSTSSLVREAA